MPKGWLGLLQLIFIIFKLTDVIDWHWVWVLAPAWLTLIGLGGLFCLALTIAILKG